VVEDKADDALAENLDFPLYCLPQVAVFQGAVADDIGTRSITGIQLNDPGSVGYSVPITGLKVGMRITGFKSRAQAPAGTTVTVELDYNDSAGGNVAVGSHSHGAAMAIVTKSGLSHDVVANRQYFFIVLMDRGVSGVPIAQWVQPIVERV
jgi:hypothetical protein